MTILRMSVFVLSFALCADAFSQTGTQPNYQCSSGTALKDGYLTYKTSRILAVAKHKDGTISEISGMLGRLEPNANFANLMSAAGPAPTYAQMAQIWAAINEMAEYSAKLAQSAQNQNGPNGQGAMSNSNGLTGGIFGGGRGGLGGMGMGGGFLGGPSGDVVVGGNLVHNTGQGISVTPMNGPAAQPTMTGEAPDREDIETTPGRYVDKRPGDNPGLRPGDYAIGTRPGDQAGLRPGDKAGLRAADQAPAYITQSFQPRNPAQPKAGELVMRPGTIAYSAQLDSQGNISEITYRIGKTPTRQWRAHATNPAGANNVYVQLASELNNIKSRAYCCTKNPGASCSDAVGAVSVQASLRSEKPSIGERMKSAWSDMINAFHTSSGSEAK